MSKLSDEDLEPFRYVLEHSDDPVATEIARAVVQASSSDKREVTAS